MKRRPLPATAQGFECRRIAADARKIELGKHTGRHLHRALLDAMGFDLGAIHAVHPRHVRAIRRDLKKRPRDWLAIASDTAAKNVRREYKSWRGTYRAKR